MNDDEFLDAILAAPDDDAPRLVYADVLTERGDARGELIVVQCARAELERDGKRGTRAHHDLAVREMQIVQGHGKRWLEAAGLRFENAMLERGFITRALGPASLLRARWDAVLTRLPLEAITLRSRNDESTLADLAWFAERAPPTVKGITLGVRDREVTFDPAALRKVGTDGEDALPWPTGGLIHRRLWPAITRLFIPRPSPQDFAAYALPRLGELAFRHANALAPAEIEAIFSKPDFVALTQFDTGSIRSEAAEAVLRATPPPKLRELALHHARLVPFDHSVTIALGECMFLPQLESLVAGFAVDPTFVGALERTALHTLDFDHQPVDAADVERLLASSLTRRLRKLSVWAREPFAPDAFVRASFDALRALDLHGFAIDEATARAMVAGLPTVNELVITARNVGARLGEPDVRTPEKVAAILRERWPAAKIT